MDKNRGMNVKRISDKEKLSFMSIVDNHVRKYRTIMIVFSILVAIASIGMIIYWNYDELSAGEVGDNIYMVAHVLFLASSLSMAIVLLLDKYSSKVKFKTLAYATHIYSFELIALSTVLCILDLSIGLSPFIYLLACVAVAGLFVTEPRFFIGMVVVSFLSILVSGIVFNYEFFSDKSSIEVLTEDIINFSIFAVLVSLVCLRHYTVTTREHKAMEKLHILTYYDELTGLLNERSYLEEIERINKAISEGKEKGFAVVLMDVNNLKATNDAYGHRYGCSLVVRCGHTLPTIFFSSKIFHIGGDEFLAIVRGDDYADFVDTMRRYDSAMLYSIVQYEGVDLIFSVARGYSFYQEGDRYQDVLQRADKEMYINKKDLKEKYNMKGR